MGNKALRIIFIGSGRAGGRICETLSKLGYEVIVLNTAKADITDLKIHESKKLILNFGIEGAGKDIEIGEKIFSENKKKIEEFIKSNLPSEVDFIFIVVGGGGGSGTGCLSILIEICKSLSLPLGVLYTFPLDSECSATKSNCLKGLNVLINSLNNKEINSLLLIDNSKILGRFPNLAEKIFWNKANREIIRDFNLINEIVSRNTPYEALDTMDFAKILSSGIISIGSSVIKHFSDEKELVYKIKNNLSDSLLVDNYDLSTATMVGIILISPSNILGKLKAADLQSALSSINELMEGATIYKGIYADESIVNQIHVYSIFGGLDLPKEKIESFYQEAKEGIEKSIEKRKRTYNLDLSFDEEEKTIDPVKEFLLDRKKLKRKF